MTSDVDILFSNLVASGDSAFGRPKHQRAMDLTSVHKGIKELYTVDIRLKLFGKRRNVLAYVFYKLFK